MAGFFVNGVSVLTTALTGAERIPADTGLSTNPFATALAPTTVASGPLQVQVPLTGFTINAPDDCSTLVINPAGTLATGTLRLPVNPREGTEFEFGSTQTQTALTVSVGSGTTHTIVGPAVTALTAGVAVKWRFAATVWYRTQ